ncbi:MAG: DUF58 domain-containing protein [Solirubrobacteraceae bacterium]
MRGPPATAAVGIAMLVAAGMFDAEPLLVAGVALTALTLGLWAWSWFAARGAALSRELAARRVEEGRPLTMRLVATARVGLPGGDIAEPLLGVPAPLALGRRRAAVRVEARFARRGRRVLEPPTLVLRDPLGVARRECRTAGPQEVLVLPRVEPVHLLDGGRRGEGARPQASVPGIEGVEPDGLVPYRPGAPASRIHWPAFARGAGLLQRRLTPDADVRPLIVLDAGGPVAAEQLDPAVRAAASLCLELARAGGCSVLMPGERRVRRVAPDLLAWPAVWASLALVEPGRRPVPGALASRVGPMIYVSARLPARADVPVPSGAAPLVVAPIAAGAPRRGRPVLEVAGCRGYAIRPGARRMAA